MAVSGSLLRGNIVRLKNDAHCSGVAALPATGHELKKNADCVKEIIIENR